MSSLDNRLAARDDAELVDLRPALLATIRVVLDHEDRARLVAGERRRLRAARIELDVLLREARSLYRAYVATALREALPHERAALNRVFRTAAQRIEDRCAYLAAEQYFTQQRIARHAPRRSDNRV
ncbi:hypothetical protein [Rhodomicrobium lacus]|uniref:hypothetical protein n=1 Tax=Rhodomicrobium lacus TaxID=2498452 RepID=UPI0026E11C47|nr:hypothetical protein [Rhodomicrobium lacus]WKW52021.1 hypothetical protein QMO75_05950 [Rhodomicrobium lacus]